VAHNRIFRLFPALAVMLAFAACAEETEYVTVVLQRPVDFAVTCVASDYSFLDIEECGASTSTAISWVLDDDMGGVFVGNARSGTLVDTDAYIPGYSPIQVGERLTRIIASPDSRDVFVAAGIGKGGGSELVRIPADFYNIVGVSGRQPMPCPILDMVMVRDENAASGWYIAALLDCAEGDELWRFSPRPAAEATADDFMEGLQLAPIPGNATVVSAGAGRVVVVSRDLPASLGYLPWDYLVVLDNVGGGDGAFTTVPVVNDSGLVPVPGVEGTSGDCLASDPAVPSGYVGGRPAVSPDGELIYVPITVPAGIAVFDKTLNRVDTHAVLDGDTVDSTVETDSWQFANSFFRYVGYKDIRMDSPVLGVSFVEIPEVGTRALAWLYGGQIVRVVVDPTEELPWPHRAENDLDDIESSAYQPVVWYQGTKLDNGIKTRTDLPSFGSTQIVLPVTEEDHYVYYGIQFNGDIEAEAPETWTLTFEGVIPGATGECGTLVSGDSDGWLTEFVLSTGNTDFCAFGVEGESDSYAGDIVDLVLPDAESCGEYAGMAVSFRVRANWGGALALRPLDASTALRPIPSACGGDHVQWVVRASEQWVVTGSRTGFLHPWVRQGGGCVVRSDFDPVFTARARTAMPVTDDLVVDSCPIARDLDSGIDWESTWFRNPVFGLWVIPGCRFDDQYRPVVVPPVRDTALKFAMETGRIPNQNDIGGLASAVEIHGGILFALDSSNGRLVIIDPATMEITYSWF